MHTQTHIHFCFWFFNSSLLNCLLSVIRHTSCSIAVVDVLQVRTVIVSPATQMETQSEIWWEHGVLHNNVLLGWTQINVKVDYATYSCKCESRQRQNVNNHAVADHKKEAQPVSVRFDGHIERMNSEQICIFQCWCITIPQCETTPRCLMAQVVAIFTNAIEILDVLINVDERSNTSIESKKRCP